LTFLAAGRDPVALANTIADFVIKYNLDGIDIDYEVPIFRRLFKNQSPNTGFRTFRPSILLRELQSPG
jgi:GH18 family chitinase